MERKLDYVKVSMTAETKEKIKELAALDSRSINNYVGLLIEVYADMAKKYYDDYHVIPNPRDMILPDEASSEPTVCDTLYRAYRATAPAPAPETLEEKE